MEASTHGALKQRFGEENLRIASMGAIQKPDGSVRPVHDGTHGVHVNQSIPQHNLLSVPGPGELALLVRQSQEQVETPFALAGDVAAAHRLVLVRERDWGLLACRVEAGSDTVFVNRGGTFGISSASSPFRHNRQDGGARHAQPLLLSIGFRRRLTCQFLWTPEVCQRSDLAGTLS